MTEQNISAILLAGGSGSRFGGDINKVLREINGKAVLLYSLEVLLAHPAIREVILVYRKADEAAVKKLAAECGGKKLLFTEGGDSRPASVRCGLKLAKSPYVLIHDAARPCLKASYVDACQHAMAEVPGASIGVKAKDTIKICDEKGLVVKTTDRALTWLVQTPQCFHRDVLLAAHEKWASSTDFTDDCMLLEAEGFPVRMLEGDYTNIKLTTPEDEGLLKLSSPARE